MRRAGGAALNDELLHLAQAFRHALNTQIWKRKQDVDVRVAVFHHEILFLGVVEVFEAGVEHLGLVLENQVDLVLTKEVNKHFELVQALLVQPQLWMYWLLLLRLLVRRH